MRGVDQAPAPVDGSVIEQPCDRALARPSKAILHLFHLLGNVDVDRPLTCHRDDLAAGGRFGVGSDSNIEISAPGELKQFEYSQRLKHRARNVLAEREGQSTGRGLYENALTGGAQALGRRIGAIAEGHRADLVVLDANHPDLAAVSGDRWLDSYVFVAGEAAIDTAFVAGEPVVRSGRHVKRDAIRARYARAMARILA
jgi:formimidoylglutamate deiminase